MAKPDELTRFQTEGPSWAERASRGELDAVLWPGGPKRENWFIHFGHLFGAYIGSHLNRPPAVLVDFGCGTGRFLRFFGSRGYTIIGTEITPAMLAEARRLGLPPRCELILTDGVLIPLADQSVDVVWCCAVLKYSLRGPDPAYDEIAQEMYRVLKPQGAVVNLEMYVDSPQDTFTRGFERAGFVTERARVLRRYGRGSVEAYCLRAPLPWTGVAAAARLCAAYRFWFDRSTHPPRGLRDYLFVFRKRR